MDLKHYFNHKNMIKYIVLALIALNATFCYGQDFNLSDENVNKFNIQIEKLPNHRFIEYFIVTRKSF